METRILVKYGDQTSVFSLFLFVISSFLIICLSFRNNLIDKYGV